MINDSLKAKTVTNLGYNIACKLLVSVLSVATMIVLARNLTASDYGIVGFAMVFIGFLGQFSDLGISASIIQKETISESDLYTGFTLKLLLGLIVFSLSFLLGSVSQGAFDNPAVRAVIIVLAANLLISCFGFVPTTILSRDLKFKRLTIPQIGSQPIATAVAIMTVYIGFRYWSIVFSNVASTIANVAIVYALCPVRFKLQLDKAAAKRHLKFGIHLFLAGIMMFFLFNADNFVVGAAGGAAALGFYSIAFNWSTQATGFLFRAIQGVLFSTFSRIQHDTERMKRGYLTILEYVSFGAVLANILLLIVSKDFLVVVLGDGTGKWLPALLSLDILCVYGIVRAILEPVASLIIAVGRPGLVSKSNAIVAALQVAFLYPALKYFGIAGVAAVVTLSYSVQFVIYFPALRREMDLRFSMVFHSVRPALLSGFVLILLGLTLDRLVGVSWLSVTIKLLAGSAVYAVIYGYVTGWKLLKDAREILGTVPLRPSRSAA